MDYGMFTKAGNAVVAKMIVDVLSLPITTTNQELYVYLRGRMDKIQNKHGEVWDTDVREAIIGTLERKLHRELTIYF